MWPWGYRTYILYCSYIWICNLLLLSITHLLIVFVASCIHFYSLAFVVPVQYRNNLIKHLVWHTLQPLSDDQFDWIAVIKKFAAGMIDEKKNNNTHIKYHKEHSKHFSVYSGYLVYITFALNLQSSEIGEIPALHTLCVYVCFALVGRWNRILYWWLLHKCQMCLRSKVEYWWLRLLVFIMVVFASRCLRCCAYCLSGCCCCCCWRVYLILANAICVLH